MVYLLSKSKKKTKGVIVFNVDEKDFFRRKIIEKIYRSEIQDLKKKYFFLMHWSWALRNERDIPHIDYHLASESGRFINRKKNKIVNFCNRNFIDKIFKEKKLTKIYDVISVIRPVHFKNLKHLFKAASQIYKKKIYPNFLVIFTINSDKEFYNSPEFFYTDLIKDYNHFIKKEHRKHFTLLPISTFNHQYQLHKEQICNFLNLSKFFILPSFEEGANRATHEALICGCPIIYYKHVIGGASDYLNHYNSISYSSENEISKKILYALKKYKKFKLNKRKIRHLLSEEYQVPKFRKFLNDIAKKDNVKIDKGIDLSELDRKLDSHKINLPKNLRAKNSNHIKNYSSFYKYIYTLLDKEPPMLKLLLIHMLESGLYILKFIKYKIYLKLKWR